MLDKNIIRSIKEKEMNRKDFLKYMGLITAGFIGFKGVLDALKLSESVHSPVVQTSKNSGFGSGRYGV